MSTGKHPNSIKNLKPRKLTREEQVNGGRKSALVQKEKRNTRQKLDYALNHPALPELIKEIQDRGYSLPEQPDIEDLAVIQTVLDYAKGNAKARRDIWEAQGIIKNKVSLDGEIKITTARFEE